MYRLNPARRRLGKCETRLSSSTLRLNKFGLLVKSSQAAKFHDFGARHLYPKISARRATTSCPTGTQKGSSAGKRGQRAPASKARHVWIEALILVSSSGFKSVGIRDRATYGYSGTVPATSAPNLVEVQKHAAHVDDRDSTLETVQEPPPLLRVEAAAHVLVNKVEGGFESVVVPRARETPEQRARARRASDARDGQGSCTMVKVDCFSRWTFLSCSKPTRNVHGAHARWRGKLGGGEFRKRLHYRKTSSSHHQRGEGTARLAGPQDTTCTRDKSIVGRVLWWLAS